MNLRQMEYLLAIAQEKTISRAAEHCYISQSGMSQQLASIERELGITMFQRVNNELLPSPEGEIYLRCAREILGLHSRAMREIENRKMASCGRILIGVSPERGSAMMQQIFPFFRQSYPNVQFHIVENHLHELEQMVVNNILDLAEAAYTPQVPSSLSEDVRAVNLYTERIMLILPRTPYYLNKLEQINASEEESVVDLRAFSSEGFVVPTEVRIRLRSLINWTFEQAGFSPKVMLETSNNVSALNFISDGHYLSFVPQSYRYSIYAQTDRILYRAILQTPYWHRAMIYRHSAHLTEAERKLIHIISEFHAPTRTALEQDNQRGPKLPA